MKVSVVIPCRNEEVYIKKCIDSVLDNDYPQEKVTIVIADGRSTDNTREVIEQISKEHNNVILIDNVEQTTPFAMNRGIECTDSDVYIILGAHAEINKDYISKCIDALNADASVGCVGGYAEHIPSNNDSKVIADAMGTKLGVGNATFRTGGKKAYVDTVGIGAYRKEVFKKCGVFNTTLTRNQDDELNYRIIKAGYKILFDPEIKAKYYVRSSFKNLAKQYFQYGYWKVYVNRMHNTVTSVRQLIPAIFVFYIFAGLVSTVIWPHFLKLYLLGIMVYFGITSIVSLKKQGLTKNAAKMVQAYLYLHFCYGIGYLEGVIDFLLLRKKEISRGSELSR